MGCVCMIDTFNNTMHVAHILWSESCLNCLLIEVGLHRFVSETSSIMPTTSQIGNSAVIPVWINGVIL